MDDRILVIPPIWTANWPPDWRDNQHSTIRTMLSELDTVAPVDVFQQPTRKGGKHRATDVVALIDAMKQDIKPGHHVVEVGGSPGEPILLAVADSPARSVTICGFYPSPRTLARRGDPDLAQAVEAMYRVLTNNPGQAVSIVMEDADEGSRAEVLEHIEEHVDRVALRRLGDALCDFQFSAEQQVKVPALYLGLKHHVPANSGQIEIFREYAPQARYDELELWGPYTHIEAAGYELAGKVTGFIKEVIAERESSGA